MKLIRLQPSKRMLLLCVMILLGFLLLENGSHITSQTATFVCESFHAPEGSFDSAKILVTGQSHIGRVASLFFPLNATVYVDGIVYDFYSIGELGQLLPSSQWLTFPLPTETSGVSPWTPKIESYRTFDYPQSPQTKSGLAYVDKIYVISDPTLHDRIENIKRMFVRHNIPPDSIEWRLGRWNRATCTSKKYQEEVYRTLNLEDGPLGDEAAHRYCAVTMKHVEIWQEIAANSSTLSLILEDDAVFVSFFKETFDWFVYTAIRTGTLKTDPSNCASGRVHVSKNEWFEQDPAFVIGSCVGLRDSSFSSNVPNAHPLLSTHKEKFSRCAHAYLLNSCSARALLKQLHVQKYKFLVINGLQTYLGLLSPTLQPFWLDPAIVYQGNTVLDLDEIPSFRRSMP
ncbi:unnamed protein product [Rotaria magnacalcarata]|uniref:Glycosyl transferase family 25 domain-containing protein n=3 Tax=Rotaria magnacalcarata TaxID=392030 RepID=A0A816S1P3_9BILA|nr:unnamed protein product [Rotaria magnacalcarata]